MSTTAPVDQAGFRAVRLFHPTAQTPDLEKTGHWFARAFGRRSTPLSAILPSRPEYPTEYSSFTVIRDVFFDSIDPKLHFINGKQRYPAVQAPSLKGLGWYIEGMEALYQSLRTQGIRCMDLSDRIAEGDEPPQSPGGGVITYFTVAEDAGLQYQFFRESPFPLDPRSMPNWELGPVEASDPLQIEHCSHHTILTSQPERALRFAVGGLGGVVVGQGHNPVIKADSTFVAVGDCLLEYAVPAPGSTAREELAKHAPNDAYYAITWKVTDLERAEKHLAEQGVHILARSGETIITEPASSEGIPWGFTTHVQPGHPLHGNVVAAPNREEAP